MTLPMPSRDSAPDSVSSYIIRIRGELDARWIDYFDGLTIVVTENVGKPLVTTLCAHAVDQAALLGILNSLYDYGFPLIALEQVEGV